MAIVYWPLVNEKLMTNQPENNFVTQN